MATRRKFSNNGTSTLLGALAAGATSCSVQAGHGSRFPSPGANEDFTFTLKDSSGNIEICKCTQRTGDTFNVIARGQEGTSDQDWDAGDLVEMRLTRDTMDRFTQKDADELITGGRVIQGPLTYATAAGTPPNYTATFAPALTALAAGLEINVKFSSAVTSLPPTLNPNGLGAKSITRIDGTAITNTDIPAGATAKLHYDGSKFLLLNPASPGKFYYNSGVDRSFVNNLRLTASLNGSNDIVIAVKGVDGNDPSATNPVVIAFRHSTITDSSPVLRTLTAALSITPLATSSFGFQASESDYFYVLAYDNGGTVVLAVTRLINDISKDEGTLFGNTTVLNASSDDPRTIYTTSALVGGTIYPVRVIGRIKATRHATLDQWASVDEVTTLPAITGREFMYESSEQSLATAPNTITVNHGLGFKPKLWRAVYRCKTAEYGYAIGDEIPILSDIDAGNVDTTTWASATQLGYRRLGNDPNITRRDAGNSINLTLNNWRLVFYAWR